MILRYHFPPSWFHNSPYIKKKKTTTRKTVLMNCFWRGCALIYWPAFKLFIKMVFNKPKLSNVNGIKSKGDERNGIPGEIGQMIFRFQSVLIVLCDPIQFLKKALPTGNRSLKAFEAKGSLPASRSLTKFSASLRMRNRYHGTNLSPRTQWDKCNCLYEGYKSATPKSFIFTPIPFWLSFLYNLAIHRCQVYNFIWGFISYRQEPWLYSGNFLPRNKSIFSIFLIVTSYM